MSETIIVDNSRLVSVANCYLDAVLQHIHGYQGQGEPAPRKAGKDIHASLAEYFRTAKPSAALTLLEMEYREFAEKNVPVDDRLSWANVRTIMEEYYRTHPIERFPFMPIIPSIERGVKVPLINNIEFWALLDLAGYEKTVGGLYVVDHKTTGKITSWWEKQFRIGSQLTGYIWAKWKETGTMPVGAFINAIELGKLPDPTKRKCAKHKCSYEECWKAHCKWELLVTTRSYEMITAWFNVAVSLARQFEALVKTFSNIELLEYVPTQGRFNGSCTFCGFRDFCAAERKPELVESMLVYEPWLPWEKE